MKKLKINFQLKDGMLNAIPIIAYINFGYKEYDVKKKKFVYKPLKYYTGITVDRDQWDFGAKKPFIKTKAVELENIEKQIEAIFNFLQMREKEITHEIFKNELDEKIKGKESKIIERIRIVDFIEDEIMTSTRIKINTKKSYRGLINKLTDFEKHIGKRIYSNDFDEEMYKLFIDTNRVRLNRINGLWSVQKVLNSTLKEIGRTYKISVFNPTIELQNRDKIRSENADAIYLNMDQIQKIIKLEPKEDRLKNAKFILMILLFTGCRESDVYKIYPQNTYDKKGLKFNYCRYISQKTNTEIIVPILKPLQKLFDKYKGEAPRKISQQKFNVSVKDLIMLCKMDDDITVSYTNTRGVKQFVTKKFYQLVSSHTGRRSFVTNFINYIPLPILTKITGHVLKDKSIIFAYNKTSLLENAALFCKQLSRITSENLEDFPFELV